MLTSSKSLLCTDIHPADFLFTPLLLSAEHVTARFGNEDAYSFAAFTVTDDLVDNFSISFFLRTRRSGGVLLVLANSSNAYLHVWLEGGKVSVQLDKYESLKSADAIDDGEAHFVSVEVAVDGLIVLHVGTQEQGHVEVRPVSVQAGDTVYVGGLLEARETAAFGGYFKGCVQDLRISDRRLQFFGLDTTVRSYPLEIMENVTVGCSGDNLCSVSELPAHTVGVVCVDITQILNLFCNSESIRCYTPAAE